MSPGAWLDIDLLRERRERFGHERLVSVPVRTLLCKGAIFGSLLPLLLALYSIWLWIQHIGLVQLAESLQPQADQYDRVEREIQATKGDLEDLVGTNQSIAKAMVDVRSSSALLAVLQGLIPEDANFSQIKINGNNLEIDGVAIEPNALRTLNSLMLALTESGLFLKDSVTLKKAELKLTSGSTSNTPRKELNFQILASFSEDASRVLRPKLLELGADGLARRVALILQESNLLK